MGIFHSEHFKRYANYSIEEMTNAINNIEPDLVFIEARESSFTEYGVVDGPVDMCVAYCYCLYNNIFVEMTDYWKIDNNNTFYNSQMEYCKLFQNNMLYMD